MSIAKYFPAGRLDGPGWAAEKIKIKNGLFI